MGVVYAIMFLDLGLRPKGVLKVGESEVPSFRSLSSPPPNVSSSSTNPKPISNGHHSSPSPPLLSPLSTVLTFFSKGIEYLTSVRGIGWVYGTGTGLHIPPEWRCTSNPQTYVSQSLKSCVWHYLIMDACNTVTMSIPGLRVSGGGGKSIFAYGNSVLGMLAVSTSIHVLTGLFLVSGTLFSILS